jgi:hypothetical protein
MTGGAIRQTSVIKIDLLPVVGGVALGTLPGIVIGRPGVAGSAFG